MFVAFIQLQESVLDVVNGCLDDSLHLVIYISLEHLISLEALIELLSQHSHLFLHFSYMPIDYMLATLLRP